jgi:HKD family nuclease
MHVQVIDNKTQDLASILAQGITRCDDVKVAVAFASSGGLKLLRPSIDSALQSGASLEFLVGLDMHATEPDAINELYALSNSASKLQLSCYIGIGPGAIYHPKMYLFRSGNGATAIVGSSNLTQGGLKRNVEVNVVLTGELMEEALVDAYSIYIELKLLPGRVVPDEELLDLYRETCKVIRKSKQQASGRDSLKELLSRFKEKARTLRGPAFTSQDLVGWQKLVYDVLPEGEFTNRFVYDQSRVLANRYPQNHNIAAKIRQQLQILRDMKLVEHLGRGRWRKM